MAIKQKTTEQKSKLIEVLTTEYKWENLLLGILATLSGALALMIISGNSLLQINADFPILGQGNNGIIFAWVLFAISLFGLILVIYPFFLPALPELKKITWPTLPKFIDHGVRVIIFLIILTGIILIYNILIARLLIGWIL
ncbi:preprotein translocase subunit SecE [Peloplasma aerotolerans]|jgi:preprotein translocase subunit SecE|uniref:Preprotein translocase subunit SecE n=1 Tax=Peloplasma aerotolerans TaxID=3044389 RepID=A0AAW6U6K0_9MOLU|nr:preprotein translocase subunit SecE [Mariniplasma sp. M4Ah]MDI6453512.1 preprotein translocase subunit SecE [Mariniplasma sp. M4Ah]MDR4969267.1 preprotein translocase subunit SecE [Acholeplasmataceae bacterium]